jgi:hypothetical protein
MKMVTFFAEPFVSIRPPSYRIPVQRLEREVAGIGFGAQAELGPQAMAS